MYSFVLLTGHYCDSNVYWFSNMYTLPKTWSLIRSVGPIHLKKRKWITLLDQNFNLTLTFQGFDRIIIDSNFSDFRLSACIKLLLVSTYQLLSSLPNCFFPRICSWILSTSFLSRRLGDDVCPLFSVFQQCHSSKLANRVQPSWQGLFFLWLSISNFLVT